MEETPSGNAYPTSASWDTSVTADSETERSLQVWPEKLHFSVRTWVQVGSTRATRTGDPLQKLQLNTAPTICIKRNCEKTKNMQILLSLFSFNKASLSSSSSSSPVFISSEGGYNERTKYHWMNFVFKEKLYSSMMVPGMCVRMGNLTWSHMRIKSLPQSSASRTPVTIKQCFFFLN